MKTETLTQLAPSRAAGPQIEVSYGALGTRVPRAEFGGSTFESLRTTLTKDFRGISGDVAVRCDGNQAGLTDQIPSDAQKIEFVARAGSNG